MYQYRQVLVRMRQGDSDRDIARTGLMGRRKTAEVRDVAARAGWLAPEVPLPEDATLASLFTRDRTRAHSTISSVEPYREQVRAWFHEGIQGTTILSALRRHHGYDGSYSALARFLQHLAAEDGPVQATSRLEFAPAEAVQVDFGAGPLITDAHTGERFKSWVFVMTGRTGLITERDCVRWAMADSCAHLILEFRRHLANPDDGVPVVVQFEHFGAEPQAGTETGA